MHGHDPDGRTLKLSGLIEIAVGIPRRVAFLAHGHVFDQIAPALDVTLLYGGGRAFLRGVGGMFARKQLRGAHAGGEEHGQRNRQTMTCFHRVSVLELNEDAARSRN